MLFEKASKTKLRFKTLKGLQATEDLWDFSLLELDDIANSLNKKIKESSDGSYLKSKKQSGDHGKTQLQLDIVIHIIKAKEEDIEKKEKDLVKKDRTEKLLELLEEKRTEGMKGLSEEEILKELEELKK